MGINGPDAETAAAILTSLRENHIAQAGGRYSQDADDDTDRATVFVRTDALLRGYVDLLVLGVERVPTDAKAEITRVPTDRPIATARELSEATGLTNEHVRMTLRRIVESRTVEF